MPAMSEGPKPHWTRFSLRMLFFAIACAAFYFAVDRALVGTPLSFPLRAVLLVIFWACLQIALDSWLYPTKQDSN